MTYQVMILGAALIGIAGALFFSGKISRSPVRRIGMVRAIRGASSNMDENVTEEDLLEVAMWGQYGHTEGAKPLNRKVWKCGKCGLTQSRGKDLRCRLCASDYTARGPHLQSEDAPGAILENRVQQHDKILDKHFEMITSLELKVRKLEIESLRNSQQIQQETPVAAAEPQLN